MRVRACVCGALVRSHLEAALSYAGDGATRCTHAGDVTWLRWGRLHTMLAAPACALMFLLTQSKNGYQTCANIWLCMLCVTATPRLLILPAPYHCTRSAHHGTQLCSVCLTAGRHFVLEVPLLSSAAERAAHEAQAHSSCHFCEQVFYGQVGGTWGGGGGCMAYCCGSPCSGKHRLS